MDLGYQQGTRENQNKNQLIFILLQMRKVSALSLPTSFSSWVLLLISITKMLPVRKPWYNPCTSFLNTFSWKVFYPKSFNISSSNLFIILRSKPVLSLLWELMCLGENVHAPASHSLLGLAASNQLAAASVYQSVEDKNQGIIITNKTLPICFCLLKPLYRIAQRKR